MGKPFEIKISEFNGGLSNDLRVNSANKYGLLRNFDPFTYSNKLVPRGALVATAISGSTLEWFRIFKMNYCYSDATHYYLFAIGKLTTTDYAIIFYWDTATSLWVSAPNGISAGGFPDEVTFFYYNNYLYWFTGGVQLQRFKTDMSEGLDETYRTFTAALTFHCQPVHHKADDCAYFFLNNMVYRYNLTAWETGSGTDGAVLELPADGYIYAACQYGNYLALGWSSLDNTKSVIFLWDRSSSLNTLSERFDIGFGKIIHLFSSCGTLKAVISSFPKVIVKQLYGNVLTTTSELVSKSTGTSFDAFPVANLLLNDKFYFPMDLDNDGGDRMGVYVINENGKIGMDYAIDAATAYQDIATDGSNMWFAYNSGSVSKISFSSTANTETGVYESLIFGDANINKKLLSVGVSNEALPASGQITLKYRLKDSDSWTTIFTNTTDGSYFHQSINIESSGANLPHFREIQFRIEGESGAIPTGLYINYEEENNNPN